MRFACAAAPEYRKTPRLILVVEFILRFVQRVLLMLDLFFRSFLLMLSLLLEGVLFIVRHRTGCRGRGIGLLSGHGGGDVFSECAVCCGYGRSGLCKSLTRPEAADGEQSCAKFGHFCIHNNEFVAESSRGLVFGAPAESSGKNASYGR